MAKTIDLNAIAVKLAENAKASGMGRDDFGCFYDADLHGCLSDAQWDDVCELAFELFDAVKPSNNLLRQWSIANSQYNAECRAEAARRFGV